MAGWVTGKGTVSQIIPAKITAGVTFETLASLAAYPAPAWALSFLLRGPSAADVTATAEGSLHRLRVEAAAAAAWLPGRYAYAVRAQNLAGEVREIEAGHLEVLADIANAAAGFDGRTQNRRTLDAINAVIEKRASRDQERYSINDRELWRTPIADLLKLRGTYVALCRAEDAKARGASVWGPALKVRF